MPCLSQVNMVIRKGKDQTLSTQDCPTLLLTGFSSNSKLDAGDAKTLSTTSHTKFSRRSNKSSKVIKGHSASI